ncbi:MAG TPA: hypothetical protein VL856_01000 [Acidimicrobiia bacterium]|nr:hypothetical protein [Acidimicrobiia bacterium]
MLTKKWIVPIFIVLCVVGVVLLVVGIVYVSVKANHLPSWFPGHLDTVYTRKKHRELPTHAHTKRGLLAIILAAAAFIGAWWVLFRYQPSDEKV